MAHTAHIRKLTIQRFRGIHSLTWLPAEGMNVILGGGDVGKTTILEAIALLLSPSNTAVLSEADYWARDNAQEFVIEAVMTLPDTTGIGSQSTFAWPWAWDGQNAIPPSADEEGDLAAPGEPVYRVRVRGTAELELAWEVMQPNEELAHFSSAVRRRIGSVRMSADERNDRDLRLVYGSALDRLLADSALRARIGKEVAGLDLHDSLNDKGKKAIESLDARMAGAALPSNLKLGLTTSQGLSIGALIGLVATENDVALPLSSWGLAPDVCPRSKSHRQRTRKLALRSSMRSSAGLSRTVCASSSRSWPANTGRFSSRRIALSPFRVPRTRTSGIWTARAPSVRCLGTRSGRSRSAILKHSWRVWPSSQKDPPKSAFCSIY